MMQRILTLADRKIGPGEPVYIIAELSANHHRDFAQAMRLVHAAKEAGADAVKLQTYTPDTMTMRCQRHEFRIKGGTPWDGRCLHDLYAEACMPWDWQPQLKDAADDLGLALFSTPFDASAVDFLERMAVPAYKIASFEIVDLPLIEKVASTAKPLVLSTGMATREEIADAVRTARDGGTAHCALLKCTSAYPAPPESMHLRTIAAMAAEFDCPVGLSDHTLGIAAAITAVALGACIIEKHLTLSRAVPGPDSAFSLEPHEFRTMVDAVRTAELALGRVCYGPGQDEENCRAFRRSLFVVADMKTGEIFTERNVRSIRPGNGLPPKHLPAVLGRRAAVPIEQGTPLSWDLIDNTRAIRGGGGAALQPVTCIPGQSRAHSGAAS
jgi:N-acetylneuraminate synthase